MKKIDCPICGYPSARNHVCGGGKRSSITTKEPALFGGMHNDQLNAGFRRGLMSAVFGLVVSVSIMSVVASIYRVELDISSLDVGGPPTIMIDVMNPEKALEVKEQDRGPSGGRGSGGNKELRDVSKGQYANQSDRPLFAPTAHRERISKPELPIELATQGVVRRKLTDEPYGDPVSQFDIKSDGPGENGGQGTGTERGQGKVNGPGGGNSNGPGLGPGPGGISTVFNSSNRKLEDEENVPEIRAIVEPMRIILKPKATYTDAARENGVQGTVTLRVTFKANGQIGAVVVVAGLPNGLTEQAVNAAKSIKFSAAKRNGVAYEVSKQLQYSFILY